MTFEIVQGDLFDPDFEFDALAQGVNTYGVMGSGIALDFKHRWPEMYEDYHKKCITNRSILPGLLHIWDESEPVIYNLFSQTHPDRDGDYGLLEKSVWLMRQAAEHSDGRVWTVGLPWIGCGVGGLKKHNVEYILRHHLTASPVEFLLVEQE